MFININILLCKSTNQLSVSLIHIIIIVMTASYIAFRNGGYMEEKQNSLEDAALKTAAQYFGKVLLPYLGIKGPLKYVAPTETVQLEVRKMYQDFNYIMENGTWLHLEFESDSIKSEDLRRFRQYEASICRTFKVQVITYVICSSKVRHPLTQLQCGINTYKVRVIRLKDNNADTLLEEMTQRQKNGEHLDTSDFVQAVLAPLMSGSMPVKERILSTLKLLRRETENLNREELDMLNAVLYAFAIKFLEHDDLSEVKEVLRMTVLGEMLWNDGYQGGYQDGYQGGELQHIISLICKKLKRGLEIPQIAQEVEEEISFVEKICQTAQLFASDYDAAKIAQELNKNSL